MKEMAEFHKKLEQGKLDEAVKHVQKAIRIDPQWAVAHQDLGICYGRMHEYEKAIPELQSASELDSHMVQPWISLSGAYLMLGRFAESEAASRRALELDPANSMGRYLLGRTLALEGHELPNAIDLLQKSGSEFPAAHLVLANMYLKQNETQEAIGELQGYLAQENAPQKEKVECMVEHLTKPAGTVSCSMQ